MEAFSNTKWRENCYPNTMEGLLHNRGGNIAPGCYPPPGRFPDNKTRHWQRNGPGPPETWEGQWSTNRGGPPPMPPHPIVQPENGCMWNRKDPPIEMTESYHHQHGGCDGRWQGRARSGPMRRDYHPHRLPPPPFGRGGGGPPNDFGHTRNHNYSERPVMLPGVSSYLHRPSSPAHSDFDPTSSPDMRTWERRNRPQSLSFQPSPSSVESEGSPRDPRQRPPLPFYQMSPDGNSQIRDSRYDRSLELEGSPTSRDKPHPLHYPSTYDKSYRYHPPMSSQDGNIPRDPRHYHGTALHRKSSRDSPSKPPSNDYQSNFKNRSLVSKTTSSSSHLSSDIPPSTKCTVPSLDCIEESLPMPKVKPEKGYSLSLKSSTLQSVFKDGLSDNQSLAGEKSSKSVDVLKSVFSQYVLNEHSYASQLTNSSQLPDLNLQDHTQHCLTTIDPSNSVISLPDQSEIRSSSSLETLVEMELETDDTSDSSPSSPACFNLDLDTEPDSSVNSPLSASSDYDSFSLIVSIPRSNLSSRPSSADSKSSDTSSLSDQSDNIRLRNGRVLNNLYLYASRKGHPKSISSSPFSTIKRSTTPSVTPDSFKNDVDDKDVEVIGVSNNFDEDIKKRKLRKSIRLSQSKNPSPADKPMTSSSSSPESLNFETSQIKKAKKKHFQDFVPVVLKTRSRAETATMLRRHEMAEEMEHNELERKATALPGEEEEEIDISIRNRTDSNNQDDSSSIASVSVLSSTRDVESTSDVQVIDAFTPEFILRCKKTYVPRSAGSGDSALHKVCRTGKLDIVRYFVLVEQMKVDVQDNAGWTPLHEACNKCHPAIAELLLQNGADPNLPSYDGTRPIHDAIESGNLSIVRLLVEHGADPMAEYLEKTPLELAKSLGQIEISKFLSSVIEERRKRVAEREPTMNSNSLKLSKKQFFTKSEEPIVMLPIEGYSNPMFGEELDSPLIYISAVIEMSEHPLLPVYNIQITSGGLRPRHHNFHLMIDVLQKLNMSRETLLQQLDDIKTHIMSVEEFSCQIKNNPLTKHSTILGTLQSMEKSAQLELVPLCHTLRRLLDIQIANIDD